jgi:hypothetical protein
MRELIIRDWKLYKDAVLLIGTVVLLMAPLSFFGLSQEDLHVFMPMLGRIAFGLGCFMPFLVHQRELHQNTLGDLLALPIARRDIVSLRWLEALFFGTLFFLLVTLPSLHAWPFREAVAAHASGTLAWIFLWAFAIQLPSQLRFGQKGGVSFGISYLLAFGWGMTSMPAKELAENPVLLQKIIHVLQFYKRAWASLGSAEPWAEALLLALLLWASYRLAVWALERCDA